MFIKLSELKPGDHFRMVSPLGLPDGSGWVVNFVEGNIWSCSVDDKGVVLTQYFNNPDLEVFREGYWQLDV